MAKEDGARRIPGRTPLSAHSSVRSGYGHKAHLFPKRDRESSRKVASRLRPISKSNTSVGFGYNARAVENADLMLEICVGGFW
jgi:hypothetical protein